MNGPFSSKQKNNGKDGPCWLLQTDSSQTLHSDNHVQKNIEIQMDIHTSEADRHKNMPFVITVVTGQ